MRLPFRHALLAATVLILAACSSTPLKHGSPGKAQATSLSEARQALADADLCCTSFSQFDYSETLPSEPEEFEIDAGKPVADFGGARSWFLAFQLPADSERPLSVVFKAKLAGRWLEHSYLFAPSIVVLDAGYHPLATKDIEMCEYMGWTHETSGVFGHYDIDNPDARYLVVYSSRQQLQTSTYWEQSPSAFSSTAPTDIASSGNYQIPHGPNGTLYVGKLTDAYRKAIDKAICHQQDEPDVDLLGTAKSPDMGGAAP